jgi:hypothetical protein
MGGRASLSRIDRTAEIWSTASEGYSPPRIHKNTPRSGRLRNRSKSHVSKALLTTVGTRVEGQASRSTQDYVICRWL